MTLCTGGSEPKPGVTDTYALTFDYMASILPPELAWLPPFLPYIRPIFLQSVVDFCGTEPTLPDLTGVTIGAVLAGGRFAAAVVAAEAIAQLVTYYAWFDLCKCTTGGPPTPATGPSAPADLPVVDPVNPLVAPCQEFTVNTFGPPWSIGSPPLIQDQLFTSTATSYRITTTVTQGGGTHANSGTLQVKWGAVPGTTYLRTDNYTDNPPASFTATRSIPPGANYVRVDWLVTPDNSSDVGHVHLELFCGANPGDTVQPCCPPDPIATGYLSQILDLVTLIQRQSVPFAYVPGTVHSGLSGAGAFGISGLLGVKVAVTTLPDHFGRRGTNPEEFFELGFLTFGTADGWPTSFRLERESQLMLPARCSAYTDFEYDLAPGVVVTVTELVREP